MATLQRRIYSSQSLSIPQFGYIPIKSVSVSREIPVEPLMILGLLDGALQQQKGPETFKIDVKAYFTSDITDARIKTLFDKTEKGIPTLISMVNYEGTTMTNAFLANVVLTNISFDTTVGDFIDVGLTFQGLGNPNIIVNSNLDPKDVSTIVPANAPAVGVVVKDSSNIFFDTSSAYGETIKSLKFSFEMPVEILYSYAVNAANAALKVNLVGKSYDTTPSNTVMNVDKLTYVAKAPYKATLNIEGQSLKQYRDGEASPAQTPALVNGVQRGGKLAKIMVGGEAGTGTGGVGLTLVNAALKSFTVDQSPGEVGANFSASYEGTHVGEFSSITTYL